MEDYQSKYTGEQVEELLDMVANGEVGGGIEAETDPIFSASPAATITEAKMAEWDGKQNTIADLATIRSGAEKGATALQSVPSEYGTKAWVTEQARDIANDAVGDFEAVAVEPLAEEVSQLKGAIGNKVDKVTGKGLSAEDFTSALKIKLEGLNNYDDTEISAAVASLQTQLDTLVSGDTTTAIKTFNEVIAFLDGIADTEDLAGIIASIEQQIAGKMDNVTLAKVATSGSYNDLSNKPTIPSAVTESTVSGWGFTKNTGTYSKPTGGIPKNDLSSAVQASLDKADAAVPIYTVGDNVYAEANGVADELFIYALPTSANGDEDDIFVTRGTLKTINGESLFGSGDITISGGGSGTITEVQANGTSVSKSGVANIPAATTSAYGVTKLTSSTSSTSTTLAATALAVKSAYDLANSYKGTVTGVKINGSTKSSSSGTVDIGNVVTSVKVNGGTYSPSSGVVDLGTISGEGSSGGGEYAGNYPVVNHGTSDTGTHTAYYKLSPNTFHIWGEVSRLYLEKGDAVPGVANEYLFQFTSGMSSTTLNWRGEDIWANGESLVIDNYYKYQISILDGLMCFTKCDVPISGTDPA